MAVIVLIDDDDTIREICQIALSRIGGHEVHAAASGHEGLDVARRHHPSVVVVDVMMPEMDGPSVAAAVRADPDLAGVPVVFLTAKVGSDELESLMATGAAGVITKPFDPMTLHEQLGEMVSLA